MGAGFGAHRPRVRANRPACHSFDCVIVGRSGRAKNGPTSKEVGPVSEHGLCPSGRSTSVHDSSEKSVT